jgi:fumarylacetoacetate (FAA) hydrolase
MKIVTYTNGNDADLGLLVDEKIYSLNAIASTMNDFLQMGESAMGKAKTIEANILNSSSNLESFSLTETTLLAPVPNPTSCRDAYAFRQHVATARSRIGNRS